MKQMLRNRQPSPHHTQQAHHQQHHRHLRWGKRAPMQSDAVGLENLVYQGLRGASILAGGERKMEADFVVV